MLSKLGLPNISKSSERGSLIYRLKIFSKITSLKVKYATHLKKIMKGVLRFAVTFSASW